jgi:hypothetical protein
MAALSALFRGNSLKSAWEFQPGGIIWRILFSPQNTIVGETRDQEIKSTKFFCVDARTGKSIWNEIEFDEPWWIGIEAVYDKWIILHRFARPDMPEHRGIYTIELATGKLLWRNDDLTYWFVHDQKLYAYKYIFEKRIGYEIDIETGSILHEYSENLDDLHELRKTAQKINTETQADLIFPELFINTRNDLTVETIVRQITAKNALQDSIEILLQNKILFVSYYQREEESEDSTLRNVLTMYDTQKERTLFTEVLMHNMRIPSPDTFFVKDTFVYFVKNQRILTGLQPWK